MGKKNSIILRTENLEQLEMMNDAQCGILLKAILAYADDGTLLETDDKLLKLAFSIFKGQVDRDTERYEEMCRRNSENGKKGGRPKKTERFSEKPNESEWFFEKPKKSLRDSDSDSDPERDPEPEPNPDPERVCECDPEPESACADPHTAHTPRKQHLISLAEVQKLAKRLGYDWDEAEAREFLTYNIDKGRTGGWSFAVQKWEEHREERSSWKRGNHHAVSAKEQAEMDDYLSCVNRFKGEEL